MLKRSKRKSNIKRHLVLILGVLFVFVGIILISYNHISNKQKIIIEQRAIDNYYEIEKSITTKIDNIRQEEYDYIGILKIPKINLIKGFVDPNSKYNDVEYNVEIIEGSDMPDIENGNFILAAHSGTGEKAFFNGLKHLEINDVIEIDYKNKTYYYLIDNIRDVTKTGEIELVKEKNKTAVTLITCRFKTDKQIVITAYKQ